MPLESCVQSHEQEMLLISLKSIILTDISQILTVDTKYSRSLSAVSLCSLTHVCVFVSVLCKQRSLVGTYSVPFSKS